MNETRTTCENTPVQGGVARACRRPAAPGDIYCVRCRTAARVGERRRARRSQRELPATISQTLPLAVYGTLRNRGTLEMVLGHAWSGEYEEVRLPDWEARPRSRSSILFARPKAGAVLKCLLIRGLTWDDLQRLDRYEGVGGGLYRRVQVEVSQFEGQRRVPAWIYADGDDSKPGEEGDRLERAAILEQREGVDDYYAEAGQDPDEFEGAFTEEEMRAILEGELTVPTSTVERAERRARISLEDLLTDEGLLAGEEPWPVGLPAATGGTSGGSGAGGGSLEPCRPSGAHRWPPVITPTWRPQPLFAYGALAFREVLEERIGHRWRGEYAPSRVEGYRVEPGWPRHIVPHEGGVVHGFLISGLSEPDVLAIDRYEGTAAGYYERISVPHYLTGKGVWLYVTGPAGYRRLERQRRGKEASRRSTISGQGGWPSAAPFRIREAR